jgi:hypothetical protein
MLPDFQKRIAFLEGFQASPVSPSVYTNMLDEEEYGALVERY